jgi:hypothetical protein
MRECDKDRSIHNFKGCLYRVKQINLHISEMEILAQPLWNVCQLGQKVRRR